jgi:predicted DNA-binding mobile mystery protein A
MQSSYSAQARAGLDRRFAATNVEPLTPRPSGGWLRAVRDALGMSQRQLAARLNLTGGAVAKFEESERHENITLRTLSKAAEGLHCRLVYAIVPRTTLKDIVERRARALAETEFGYVATTMALELQEVEDDRLEELINERVRALVAAGDLWRDEPSL